MFRDGSHMRLAATDVSNHLACRHLTELDRAVAEGRHAAPDFRDPMLAVLQARGLEHERAYLAYLRGKGLRVAAPETEGGKLPAERAIQAMKDGADVIVQAELQDGRWYGRADVLLKVEAPSDLGPWSYEVVDTKLAQETRAGAVLQLCQYSELVARIQGAPPERMYIVKPGVDFVPEEFRFADYGAYYRMVRRRLEEALAGPAEESTYPDPVPHCEVCRWWRECDTRRHKDDALSLVAGLRPLHATELQRQGVQTLEQYAREPGPYRERPQRGSTDAYVRAHSQAQVQLEGREARGPRYRLLPPEEGMGFFRLPLPDDGDVFFDIESDPFAGTDGMEYLLGFAYRGESGTFDYRALWAFSPGEECRALEQFMDFVMERWEKHPAMRIYHYSPYEPGAVKRLAGRYGTREAELDKLLRGERFVDLLAVTRHGVQASVEGYSLKALEDFSGFTRALDLPAAAAALRRVARALELTGASEITAEERAAVETYNRDDCLSTAALRDWLEKRREEHERAGVSIPRPENKGGEASELIEERAADVQVVFDRLAAGLPENRDEWGPSERARWLLAHQLEYFRREDKSAWWEFFRIHELDSEELRDERKAAAGLTFVGEVPGPGQMPVHRYSFPDQEAFLEEGKELYEVGNTRDKIGRVFSFDPEARLLDIQKNGRSLSRNPDAVMVNDRVPPAPVDRALLTFAASVAAHGVDGEGPYRAARDLLLARPPRLRGGAVGPLRHEGEDVTAAAIRLAKGLEDSVLPIQGPPGSGKTWTGARMIVELVREGKRVGVTAVSHKVIQKLLEEAVHAAVEAGLPLIAVHRDNSAADAPDGIEMTKDNDRARAALRAGCIVGGTAWFWSREEMIEAADYLFVDEAGQMSLAHALATGRSARNIVLLGDPRQLEQPQKGAHPEGAEVAALVHVLQGRKTIPDETGLFLDTTWRLHPSICRFTSELYYEGRLGASTGLEKQRLGGPTPYAGSGLFFAPVGHSGNQNNSAEEVDAVSAIVHGLRQKGVTWTDREGRARPLERKDILVVAPYNAQVAALARAVGEEARVGTVDRFQGQEAPVVIYSMTSSSAQDAPRGMSFLYSPNRLNVATSRARCACIIVASPRLLEPECSSPEQMWWANGLCRYRELAAEVDLRAPSEPAPGAPDAPVEGRRRRTPTAGQLELGL